MDGLLEVSKCELGIFLFKFQDMEGLREVLQSGPWMVMGVTLVLRQLEKDMDTRLHAFVRLGGEVLVLCVISIF